MVKHIGRQHVLNDYLYSLNAYGERQSNRFWLVANTKWGKELIGSVTPVNNSNLFTGLDGAIYSSLDKLLVAFANTYFPNDVENASASLNGRSYFALFGDFKTYDKIEILETGTLLCDIPGMDQEV
jgi:hypothetical protein